MKKTVFGMLLTAILVLGISFACGTTQAQAAASEITVSDINYEELTMKVYKNENTIVYMSSDNKGTWNEVEGAVCNDGYGDYILMDISWISSASAAKLSFKGDRVKTVYSCTLPKYSGTFKVKFDSLNSDFDFTTDSDSSIFYWRKSTDYDWHAVPFDKTSAGYTAFLKEIYGLRFKGATIVFKLGQQIGLKMTDSGISDDMGRRPSKEVAVKISKFASAPSVKLNVTKLVFNTKITLEYCPGNLDPNNADNWSDCTKNMSLEDIAPEVFASDSAAGTTTTIYFRTAATTKKPASQISVVTVPGQAQAIAVGSGSDVSVSYADKKTVISFKASSTNQYEYCVVKPDKGFDLTTAKWKTIKKDKDVKLSEKAVPNGTKIYVRRKGVTANVNKGIEMALPSAETYFTIVNPNVE